MLDLFFTILFLSLTEILVETVSTKSFIFIYIYGYIYTTFLIQIFGKAYVFSENSQ